MKMGFALSASVVLPASRRAADKRIKQAAVRGEGTRFSKVAHFRPKVRLVANGGDPVQSRGENRKICYRRWSRESNVLGNVVKSGGEEREREGRRHTARIKL